MGYVILLWHSLSVPYNYLVYSIGTFCAPVATQVIVKVDKKIAKSLIFESIPFLYVSTFSG